jgi:hypothetical protein
MAALFAVIAVGLGLFMLQQRRGQTPSPSPASVSNALPRAEQQLAEAQHTIEDLRRRLGDAESPPRSTPRSSS